MIILINFNNNIMYCKELKILYFQTVTQIVNFYLI